MLIATCGYTEKGFKWFIGMRYTNTIICTAKTHKRLVNSLRAWMKRNKIKKIVFTWENDERVQTVRR